MYGTFLSGQMTVSGRFQDVSLKPPKCHAGAGGKVKVFKSLSK